MKKTELKKLKRKIVFLLPLGIIIIGLMLFLPAGTFNYWHAWAFMGVMFVPLLTVVFYFFKKDPELLERRMRNKEKEAKEIIIIKIAKIFFFIGFVFPGIDYRYGWSHVPVWLVVLSDAIIFLAYMLIFLVFTENSYTSRIVEVDKKQKVITTGPYSIVRHPMYAGIIPMYLLIPLALGSYYAVAFYIPVIVLIFYRIFDEERVLCRELYGYKQYMKKVRYRLIPRVW